MTTDPRFTGHVVAVLVTVDGPPGVEVDVLGQLIADAVIAADVPMVADVVGVPVEQDEQDEQLEAVAYAWRTAQPMPGPLASFAVALHVPPETTSEQVDGLMTMAHDVISAQVNAARTEPTATPMLPLAEEQFRRAARDATRIYRTRLS